MEEGWERERPPRVELSLPELERLIEPAFPDAVISEQAVLATGLANTNVRFRLRGHERAYVLRVHTREAQAARREQAVMSYLGRNAHPPLPLAPLLYSDPVPRIGEHPYSIWAFVEGTLLQELFKTASDSELNEMATACGRVAAALTAHRFSKCGELGAALEVVQEYGAPSQFVPSTLYEALHGGLAGKRLGAPLSNALWAAVERAAPLLEEIDDRYTLVHADYKRSNLLLQRTESGWSVSAVLDWEFAFAGPPLIDVGLFLRAGSALPPGFRDAFVHGYRDAGGALPAEWLRLSRLLDLLSQMTFLNDARDRPRVIAETTKVVEETLRVLE